MFVDRFLASAVSREPQTVGAGTSAVDQTQTVGAGTSAVDQTQTVGAGTSAVEAQVPVDQTQTVSVGMYIDSGAGWCSTTLYPPAPYGSALAAAAWYR